MKLFNAGLTTLPCASMRNAFNFACGKNGTDIQ